MYLSCRLQNHIRAAIYVCILSILSVLHGNSAFAGEFRRLYSFGDSYTDISNNGPGTATYPSKHEALSKFSSKSYYPLSYSLFSALGLTDSEAYFGYGQSGATAQEIIDRGSLKGQVSAAIKTIDVSTEKKFDSQDVIIINIGINDADIFRKKYDKNTAADQPAKDGYETAASAAAQVKLLVEKGAKNIVFSGFSSVGFVKKYFESKNLAQVNLFAASYYSGLQKELAPLTKDGARIFLVNIDSVYARVGEKLSAYGFKTYNRPPDLPDGAAQSWQSETILSDSLHPSTGGFKLVANYMARFLNNPGNVQYGSTLILRSEDLKGYVSNLGSILVHQETATKFDADIDGSGLVTSVGSGPISPVSPVTNFVQHIQ